MGDPRHHLGRSAEEAVATWLVSSGWKVLARRLRSDHGGEIDLVALDPELTLVAVEVRARRSRRAGTAAESVDHRRVARLTRTLTTYAGTERPGHAGLRVDLVTVEPAPDRPGRWRLHRLPDVGGDERPSRRRGR